MKKNRSSSQKNFFKKLFSRKYIHYYLLFLILVTAAIVRFYNYPFRYGIGEETVRDAVIGLQGARELQAPLTGAFSSLGPFTFGPWYAYQMLIFSLIVPTLYAPWIYLSITSLLCIFFLYKIGEELYGRSFGLLLAVMAAFSPSQIISATHLTSHNMTNLFAVLAVWIFIKIIKKDISYWWGFFLGFFIGIGISLHYQIGGMLILPLIALFYKPKRYKYFLTTAAGTFVTFIPMLLFELNNHWFNTRNLISYFVYGENRIYIPDRWLFYLRDFWPALWADTFGVPKIFAVIIIVLFSGIVGWLLIKRKLPLLVIFLIIPFLFYFFFLRYYTGPKFFGYLNFLRPFIIIFTGMTFLYISKVRYGIVIASLLFLSVMGFEISQIPREIEKDGFSIAMYERVGILEKNFPDKKFTVYNCSRVYRSNAEIFSVVFILDKHHKLADKGVAIGLKSQDCNDDPSYVLIDGTNFVDLSKKTSKQIEKEGWKPESFKSIYNLNARWWFQIQP